MSIQLNHLNIEPRDLEQNECEVVAGGFLATVAAIAGGISAVAGGIDAIDKATSSTPQTPQTPQTPFSDVNPNQAIRDAIIVKSFS